MMVSHFREVQKFDRPFVTTYVTEGVYFSNALYVWCFLGGRQHFMQRAFCFATLVEIQMRGKEFHADLCWSVS